MVHDIEMNSTNERAEHSTEEATWAEVGKACFNHSLDQWIFIALGAIAIVFFLFFFMVGLDLLGSSARVLGSCSAGEVFSDEMNPVAALMIGTLAAALLQSGSATISIIVSLVGGGVIGMQTGIYIMMGANVGRTVTSTIVAIGHSGNADELERSFAGATVDDMFNLMNATVHFFVEITTGYLYRVSLFIVGDNSDREGQGSKWTSPLRTMITDITKPIIVPNKKVAKDVARGSKTCDDYYPVFCANDVTDYSSCVRNGSVGLITCDKKLGCPAFFRKDASRRDDEISGAIVFVLGLAIVFVCLIAIVTVLQRSLSGMSTRIMSKANSLSGYLAIPVGGALAFYVQNSIVFTSMLVPFVGSGAVGLETMHALTLGANLGTTVTGLLASLVSDGTVPLQMALCNVIFNVTGVVLFYPIPFMRMLPLNAAKALGRSTRQFRLFPIMYLVVVFGVMPQALLFLSYIMLDFDGHARNISMFGLFLAAIVMLVICSRRKDSNEDVEMDINSEEEIIGLVPLAPPVDFARASAAVQSAHPTTSGKSIETGTIHLVGVTVE